MSQLHAIDEVNDNINEAIHFFKKILNHPNTHRIHNGGGLWLKDDIIEFIDILRERKEDFRNGIFDLQEAFEVIDELNGDLEIVVERFKEELDIQARFNNVDKYEGFDEALVAIGSKRDRKSRKPKRHRKRRKTRRRRKM